MSPAGDQIFAFDNRSILSAFREMQKAINDVEKGVVSGAERMDVAMEKFVRTATTVNDRAKQSQERYLRSIEATAAAYGRTGTDKLIAQRDQIIKRLGTEEEAVRRVTAAYAKMIEVEKNRKPGGGGGEGGAFGLSTDATSIIRGFRDIIEGRSTVGEVQIGKGLLGLSGSAAAIGGITTALIGLTAAAVSSARSVADYGREIHDAEIKTGLTAEQVQKFQFAAKVTGTDIGILDRMMRGLTQAVEGTDAKADRVRKTMIGMGIDIRSVRDGTTSTMELFEKLSEALEKQPDLWKRNKEMIDIFTRAGITSAPMMMELIKLFKESTDIKFASEEQVKRFQAINVELTKAETIWDQFMLRVKGALAEPFVLTLEWVMKGGDISTITKLLTAGLSGSGVGNTAGRAVGETIGGAVPGLGESLGGALARGIGGRMGGGMRPGFEPPGPPIKFGPTAEQLHLAQGQAEDAAIRAFRANQGPEFRLKEAEKALSALPFPTEGVTTAADRQAYEAAERRVEAEKNAVKALNEQKSTLEAIRKLEVESADRFAHPFGLLPAEKKLEEVRKLPTVTPAEIERARQALRPELDEQVKDILRKAGLQPGPGGRISRTDLQLRSAPGEMGFVGPSLDLTAKAESQMRAAGKLMQENLKIEADGLREQIKTITETLTEARKGEQRQAENRVKLFQISSPDTAANRLAAEQELLRIRKQAAQAEYDEQKSKISDLYGDKDNREKAYFLLRLKYADEVNQAEQQYAEQRAAETRKQLDEIKQTAESLFHTLFTSPSGFGRQLATTVRDAVLKPIESGLAGLTASILQPTIAKIGGGLGGLFGGGTRSVAITGSGAALVHVENFGLGGGGGGVGTSVFGGFGGGSGFGAAGLSALQLAGFGGGFGGGGATAPSSGGGVGVGSSGGFGGVSTPGGIGGGGVFGSGGLFGGPGGTGGFAGPVGGLGGLTSGGRGLLSNLATEAGFGTHVFTSAGTKFAQIGNQSIPLDTLTGKLTAFSKSNLAKAGALTAGTFLAERGLLGASRGTLAGIGEGALGGAGIGFSVGGPLGAAIGAGVGLLVGIGEKIAGVESPENEAKRLVLSIYKVRIDTATARQIAGIAKQQYGGHISVAVRAPEVRDLIMLWAQATGQGNLMSNTTPRAGGLQELNGSLSQMPIYANGTPYAYQSSLPVSGGFAANIWPGSNPSSPVINGLQISIGGRGAAQFMAGSVVTPENIQTTVASAYQSSNNRVPTSALLNAPGLITG